MSAAFADEDDLDVGSDSGGGAADETGELDALSTWFRALSGSCPPRNRRNRHCPV